MFKSLLQDPHEQIRAIKLKNKILQQWNHTYQETIQHLCEEMSQVESVLGEKYEHLMRHVKSMEEIPQKIDVEHQKLVQEINAIKTGTCDDEIGDTKHVPNHVGTRELKQQLDELRDERDALLEEKQKLSKVITSIQEGDTLVNSRIQRLEQENQELRMQLESQSKRSSLSLLDKIEFNDINEADSGVVDGFSVRT